MEQPSSTSELAEYLVTNGDRRPGTIRVVEELAMVVSVDEVLFALFG